MYIVLLKIDLALIIYTFILMVTLVLDDFNLVDESDGNVILFMAHVSSETEGSIMKRRTVKL